MAEAKIEMQDAGQIGAKSGAESTGREDKPICLLMLGMAGSGKSTLVQVSGLIFTYDMQSVRRISVTN